MLIIITMTINIKRIKEALKTHDYKRNGYASAPQAPTRLITRSSYDKARGRLGTRLASACVGGDVFGIFVL